MPFLRLGWALVSVLKSAERFAEALEILDGMAQGAREADNPNLLSRIEWERSWMQDYAAGRLLYSGTEPVQLTLGFAASG